MYTIVGLGNPGEEYAGTHHNAGREIVELFLSKNGGQFKFDKKANAEVGAVNLGKEKARVVLPNTFMNKS
ncbi:MAG: aminoacyl-tRNA hydrolase, partial [Patescibacteria group bacterium]